MIFLKNFEIIITYSKDQIEEVTKFMEREWKTSNQKVFEKKVDPSELGKSLTIQIKDKK